MTNVAVKSMTCQSFLMIVGLVEGMEEGAEAGAEAGARTGWMSDGAEFWNLTCLNATATATATALGLGPDQIDIVLDLAPTGGDLAPTDGVRQALPRIAGVPPAPIAGVPQEGEVAGTGRLEGVAGMGLRGVGGDGKGGVTVRMNVIGAGIRLAHHMEDRMDTEAVAAVDGWGLGEDLGGLGGLGGLGVGMRVVVETDMGPAGAEVLHLVLIPRMVLALMERPQRTVGVAGVTAPTATAVSGAPLATLMVGLRREATGVGAIPGMEATQEEVGLARRPGRSRRHTTAAGRVGKARILAASPEHLLTINRVESGPIGKVSKLPHKTIAKSSVPMVSHRPETARLRRRPLQPGTGRCSSSRAACRQCRRATNKMCINTRPAQAATRCKEPLALHLPKVTVQEEVGLGGLRERPRRCGREIGCARAAARLCSRPKMSAFGVGHPSRRGRVCLQAQRCRALRLLPTR